MLRPDSRGLAMDFVAVDVETANADMASICQIGVVRFSRGAATDEWKSYVDPEDYFDGVNVSIHGITETTVTGAPTFAKLATTLDRLLASHVVVTHTHFDRVALCQASSKAKIPVPVCTWLDSARVARRAWKEFSVSGYGLGNVCKSIGYSFTPHDALEDAKAAGQIVLAAITQSGLGLDGWLQRVTQPIDPDANGPIVRTGNPDGLLYGEVMVFTGALEIPRREAADLAASVGCRIEASVTKHTTLLVVGDQDVLRLAGNAKSSKHRKAEELIAKGQPIRILRESDFREIVKLSTH
jgi:DNA polymerase III subunit epsilon